MGRSRQVQGGWEAWEDEVQEWDSGAYPTDHGRSVRLIEAFHGRPPRSRRWTDVRLPRTVYAIGTAERTDYLSDKRDPASKGPPADPEAVGGRWKLFTHEHDTEPFVYVPQNSGLITLDGLRPEWGEALSEYGTETLDWLGFLSEAVFVPLDGTGRSLIEPIGDRDWSLWATSDAKAMVLAPWDFGLGATRNIIVWYGYGFRVTRDGIEG